MDCGGTYWRFDCVDYDWRLDYVSLQTGRSSIDKFNLWPSAHNMYYVKLAQMILAAPLVGLVPPHIVVDLVQFLIPGEAIR